MCRDSGIEQLAIRHALQCRCRGTRPLTCSRGCCGTPGQNAVRLRRTMNGGLPAAVLTGQ